MCDIFCTGFSLAGIAKLKKRLKKSLRTARTCPMAIGSAPTVTNVAATMERSYVFRNITLVVVSLIVWKIHCKQFLLTDIHVQDMYTL